MKVKITTQNAAFESLDKPYECARILREIAIKLENGREEGIALDVNGNTVGEYKLT